MHLLTNVCLQTAHNDSGISAPLQIEHAKKRFFERLLSPQGSVKTHEDKQSLEGKFDLSVLFSLMKVFPFNYFT